MTLDEVYTLFEKRLSYKPNTMFSVSLGICRDCLEVRGAQRVPDADNPVKIASQYFLWTCDLEFLHRMNEADFIGMLRRQIVDFEMHEINEFLRIDGKFVVDPHPELKR